MRDPLGRIAMRLALILLWFTFSSPAPAQAVEDQIRAEVRRYVAAINGGNPNAVAALYLDTTAATSVGDGEMYRGRQAIADLLRQVYAQDSSIQMSVDSVAVLRLGADAAVATTRYRWVLRGPPAQRFAGAMTLVYLRTPSGWRVAHDHTSTLARDALAVPASPQLTDSGLPGPVRAISNSTITRIVDGDTIECGRRGRVRLIGIDAPESDQEPFGSQATAALSALIQPGSVVQLELDVETRDRYDRLLAYVWSDGLLINWALVRQGWAVLLTFPLNVQYVDWFTEAERRAREEGRGLWAVGGFDCQPVDRRRGRCD
jgi:micrococcal nuclease